MINIVDSDAQGQLVYARQIFNDADIALRSHTGPPDATVPAILTDARLTRHG